MENVDAFLIEKLNTLGLVSSGVSLYQLIDDDVIKCINCLLKWSLGADRLSVIKIQIPRSTLARFKLANRLATDIEELGYYSVVNYETFLTPDFSPQGSTRNVISWLLSRLEKGPPDSLKKMETAFSDEISQSYFGIDLADISKTSLNFLRKPSQGPSDITNTTTTLNTTMNTLSTVSPPIQKSAEKEKYEDLISKIDQKRMKYEGKLADCRQKLKMYEYYQSKNTSGDNVQSEIDKIDEAISVSKLELESEIELNSELEKNLFMRGEKKREIEMERKKIIEENMKLHQTRSNLTGNFHEIEKIDTINEKFEYISEIEKIEKMTSLIQRQYDDVMSHRKNLEVSCSRVREKGTELERAFKQCQNIFSHEIARETKHTREFEELIEELHQAGSLLSLKIQERFELQSQIDRAPNPEVGEKRKLLVKMIQNSSMENY